MATFEDMLAASRRPRASVSLCLRGTLFSERRHLLAEIKRLEKDSDDDSLAGNPDLLRARTRLDELETLGRATTYEFTFEALPANQYQALEDSYPAAEGEALSQAFLTALTIASLVGYRQVDEPPEQDDKSLTAEQIGRFGFSAGQLELLQSAAFAVNRETTLPFGVTG